MPDCGCIIQTHNRQEIIVGTRVGMKKTTRKPDVYGSFLLLRIIAITMVAKVVKGIPIKII
jgi:hypothetical protein